MVIVNRRLILKIVCIFTIVILLLTAVPVTAVFNAIDRALKTKYKIESYQVRSITEGRQAMGETLIRIRYEGKSFTGRGVSTDIIEASAKAYLHAINLLEIEKRSRSETNIPELEVERQV